MIYISEIVFFTCRQKPSSTFTGNETAANPNAGNASSITMTAQWRANCTGNCSEIDVDANQSVGYDYTGKSVGVTFKRAGRYKLEVWGAQGGNTPSGYDRTGGYGGYSYGTIQLTVNSLLYVFVGEQGHQEGSSKGGDNEGGWNGGGTGNEADPSNADPDGSGGGGASDISVQRGTTDTSWNDTKHLYSRIIVAGGGGGAAWSWHNGGSGGGFQSGSAPTGSNGIATQTSGYAFGYSAGAIRDAAGGGGGWYGGYSAPNSVSQNSSTGGSGYIYNSASESSYPPGKLVNSSYYLSDAGMYQYSTGCTTSTATALYTVCTSSTGAHVANAANTGNGYAKITYLGT